LIYEIYKLDKKLNLENNQNEDQGYYDLFDENFVDEEFIDEEKKDPNSDPYYQKCYNIFDRFSKSSREEKIDIDFKFDEWENIFKLLNIL
jgi:hypothetical protein